MPPKKSASVAPAKKQPPPKGAAPKKGGPKKALAAAEGAGAAPPRPPKPRLPAKAAPPGAGDVSAERYWEAVGRRKTAVARVRLFTKGEKGVWVNGRPAAAYFTYPPLRQTAEEALELMKTADRFRVTAKVKGGGLKAQAEAIRHGTARALVIFNPDFRKRLKRAGFLRRDPRMKERKKFGLKGARRAPQWAKR